MVILRKEYPNDQIPERVSALAMLDYKSYLTLILVVILIVALLAYLIIYQYSVCGQTNNHHLLAIVSATNNSLISIVATDFATKEYYYL